MGKEINIGFLSPSTQTNKRNSSWEGFNNSRFALQTQNYHQIGNPPFSKSLTLKIFIWKSTPTLGNNSIKFSPLKQFEWRVFSLSKVSPGDFGSWCANYHICLTLSQISGQHMAYVLSSVAQNFLSHIFFQDLVQALNRCEGLYGGFWNDFPEGQWLITGNPFVSLWSSLSFLPTHLYVSFLISHQEMAT